MMNTLFTKIIFTSLLLGSTYSLFAHVELDNPKGGETFVGGSTVNIQWHITIAHTTLNWDLLYSSDGGATWEYIQENIPVGALSYQWHVPNEVTSQARISIIQDNEGQDYQDESNDFTIQSGTTSLSEIPDFDVKIYPNPVSETLTVDFNNNTSWPVQLALLDVYGRSLWYARDEETKMYIPLRSFATGIYFLQMQTAEGTAIRRIVVERS